MLNPGDVVTASFAGAVQTKRRPLVEVSTDAYHSARPDVILSEITTQIQRCTAPTDYVLLDWAAAGLRTPSAFRVYLRTMSAAAATRIGRLSDRDWLEVQSWLRLGLAVT